MARPSFDEALQAHSSRPSFDDALAQHGNPESEDPKDMPTPRNPRALPPTHLEAAPMWDKLRLGLKAKDEDRLAGAKEIYPDSMVEGISDGSIVVRKPDGGVYNFEKPDVGQALTGIARRLVGMDSEIRDNPTIARNLDENASAALPETIIRGVPSALAAGLTGGAGLLPNVVTQALAGSAGEHIRNGINRITAGGDSQAPVERMQNAQDEGGKAAAGTLALGYAGSKGAEIVGSRLGLKGPLSRDIAKSMGATSEANPKFQSMLDDVDKLGVPSTEAPLSIAERANPEAGSYLKKAYSDPKVADQAAFAEREGQDAVRAAGEGRVKQVKDSVTNKVESTRLDRNKAIKDIRKSDPELNNQLESAKPREIREVIEKGLSPENPQRLQLNKSWSDLDAARSEAKLGVNHPEIAEAKTTMRAVKESGRRIKPDAPKAPLLGKPVAKALRIGLAAGTFGVSEAPALAAKLARFAKGSPHRALITRPEVRSEVLKMLADGVPDIEISRFLVGVGGSTGEEQ